MGNKNEYDKSVLKEIRISQERQIIQLTIIPLSLGYTRLWEYKMACQIFSAKIFIFIISQIYTPASKNVWINIEGLSSLAIGRILAVGDKQQCMKGSFHLV